MSSWEMVLKGMKDLPDPTIMEHFFYNAVKDHRDLTRRYSSL